MKEIIKGKAYVVGNDIDTDQIIPAQHLVYSLIEPNERKLYGRYALSGVPAEQQGLPLGNKPFTDPDQFRSEYSIVIGGKNFGCGSSREHAPFAMKEAGCEAVIAESFARIFYRNAVDGGFVAPFECMERLVDVIRTGDELELDTTNYTLTNQTTGQTFLLHPLGDVADILKAGDVFEYARRAGMMKV
jgi:3-isopropylmalate/(R)-2-methylmalate dehydratase small subunit